MNIGNDKGNVGKTFLQKETKVTKWEDYTDSEACFREHSQPRLETMPEGSNSLVFGFSRHFEDENEDENEDDFRKRVMCLLCAV